MGLGLVQRALSEVGFAPSAASVEHVNGPTLPVISRSYVDTEFHGSLNSPVVNFADSNESLLINATRQAPQHRGRRRLDRSKNKRPGLRQSACLLLMDQRSQIGGVRFFV